MSLSHASLVIIRGVQPPLNVFNCVFAQKYCTSSASSCVHYILNFVQENVKNCKRTLITQFTSEFTSFCFVPDLWLGALLENS